MNNVGSCTAIIGIPTLARPLSERYSYEMNNFVKYDNAASTWTKKILRLGYAKAYSGFFENDSLASGSVLDVGAGTGAFAMSWIEAGGSLDLTLLDPSTTMLEHANAHFVQRGLKPKVLNCKFEDFPGNMEFDVILASHVFEHFDDPSVGMLRLAQKLSPRGRLYLVVSKPHWCNWMIWLRFRHRWFRREAVCEMAKVAGLKEERFHKFHTGPPSRTSFGYIFSKP